MVKYTEWFLENSDMVEFDYRQILLGRNSSWMESIKLDFSLS